MKKYGVGIVGFGWVAGAHMTTYMSLPSFKPAAIMSRRALDFESHRVIYAADKSASTGKPVRLNEFRR